MSYYSFPILSVSELVSWLSNLERPEPPLVANDLTNPTFANMRIVYYQFVQMIMGIRIDELQQPIFDYIDALGAYPQLHESSLGESTIVKSLCDLMQVVGVRDFSWRDIVYPDKKRTLRNLSAIVNFAKFRQDRLETFNEFLQQTEILNETRAQLHDENQQLNGQKEISVNKLEAEKPQVEKLKTETDELNARLGSLNKRAVQLRRDIHEEKQRNSKLADQNDSDKFTLMSVKKDIDKIESQIVRSPERIKKTLSKMSELVEKEKRNIQSKENTIEKKQSKLDQRHKVERRVDKRINSMDELAEILAKSKKISKDIKEQNNQIATNEEKIDQLTTEDKYYHQQMVRVETKVFEMQKRFESKRAAANMAIAESQEQNLVVERKMKQNKQQVDRNLAEVEAKRKQLSMLTESHETEMKVLQTKYDELSESLRDYHHRLRTAMNAQSVTVL